MQSNKGRKLEGKGLWDPQGGGWKRSLLQVFCCRVRDETGELDLGEQREKRRSVSSLPGFHAGVVCGLAGCACWSWGLECSDK